jgi:hypothetical protein
MGVDWVLLCDDIIVPLASVAVGTHLLLLRRLTIDSVPQTLPPGWMPLLGPRQLASEQLPLLLQGRHAKAEAFVRISQLLNSPLELGDRALCRLLLWRRGRQHTLARRRGPGVAEEVAAAPFAGVAEPAGRGEAE